MPMTPTEEAHLRLALAEREKRLANALANTQPGVCPNIPDLRAAVMRLRLELDQAGRA